tara:strand:- start:1148 stop:2176 length:1029 start_codon:yes stop_codon:yes gene_type:complete
MAYSTGSATDLGDLLTKLDTFLVANGWTQDDFDDGVTTAAQGFAQWNKGSVHVGVKWIANDPIHMSLHHALGNGGAVFPGAHTDDSGNGYNGPSAFGTQANLLTERACNFIGDGPFASYHFFEQDSGPAYVHVVVEITSEVFRHFGWGTLEKFNDWTGGEYAYASYQDRQTNSSAIDTVSHPMFDGIANNSTTAETRKNTTIHAEGLPHQGVNEKWLNHAGGALTDTDTDNQDTAGEIRRLSQGGFRGGPLYPLMQFRSDVATGHIPLTPLQIWTSDFVSDFSWYLGQVPDVRMIDIFNFSPGQEVTIGSDVWVIFPQGRRTEDAVSDRTYYSGIAYKKVTA